jgi:stress-induced morphogen
MICIKLITNGTMNLMALSIKEIKELITSLIPDATIEIKDLVGDSNHYSAKITSKIFNGKTKIEQHKLVYKSLQGKMGNELHALSITTEGK